MTKPWSTHRERIHELYKKQGKSLEETMQIMRTQHGFDASRRTYRTKFKDWKWTKYNKRARTDDRVQMRASGAAPSYEAPLMTPGPSSEGDSAMGVPVTAGASNGSNSSYAFRSSEIPYSTARLDSCRGSGSPSSSTLSPITYSHHQSSQQTYFAPILQANGNSLVRESQPAQPNGGAFGFIRPYDQIQGQQSMSSYRPILPAQQNHGQHQNLRVETNSVSPSAYHAFLSPTLSASSSVQHFEQVNSTRRNTHVLRDDGKLIEHSSITNAYYLTPFEQYIQTFVSPGNEGAHISPEEVHDFCRGCAVFVQQNADLSRIVPPNFELTLRMSLVSPPNPAASIEATVLGHQQYLQREQQDGGLVVPPWVSVWAWTCQQSLNGNLAGLNENLTALSYLLNDHVDVQSLRSLLPRPVSPAPYGTPQSSSNQQPDHRVWEQ